jgi:hypothetical protein
VKPKSKPKKPSRTRVAALRAGLGRHRIVSIAALLALVAGTAAGFGELAAGHMIRDRIAQAAPNLGSDLAVNESGSALWDMANKHVAHLDVSSDDATVGKLTQVSVQAKLNDVRLADHATVASTTAEVDVPTQSIAAAVQAEITWTTVSSVTTDPSSGTIVVDLGPGGLAQLTLKPELTHGRVTVSATSLNVLGRAVPPSAMGGETGSDMSSALGTAQAYPLGLKATSLTVEPDSLRVSLRGGRSTMTVS